jgi:hypothetical protein
MTKYTKNLDGLFAYYANKHQLQYYYKMKFIEYCNEIHIKGVNPVDTALIAWHDKFKAIKEAHTEFLNRPKKWQI